MPDLLGGLASGSVVLLLLAWLFLTVIYATPLRDIPPFQSVWLTRVIPRWNFFAPRPGVHDYILLRRLVYEGGGVGAWEECHALLPARTWTAAVWNPHKRVRKALFDLTVTLGHEVAASEQDRTLIRLSVPYLMLLNYVSDLPHHPSALGVQFLLMEMENRSGETEVVLASDVHALLGKEETFGSLFDVSETEVA